MPRPLLLIHGYSADAKAFHPLRDALQAQGVASSNVDIANYVSLNNEVTIKDLAEGLDRALRSHPVLQNENAAFDAVVHSTGMLVLRCWLTNYGPDRTRTSRLCRLKHLIGLAPATWGSPQAHKGRTWIGALVKGNRALGPDFLNAGDCVLDGLELGSAFTWQLAHADLLIDPPYYDNGPETPFVSVFIGNQGYSGLASVANDPGTDGTVRWAGCSLNTRKIVVDLTRSPAGDRVTISRWAENRLEAPMIPVNGKNHSTILAEPDPAMVSLLVKFLQVADAASYSTWLAEAMQFGDTGRAAMLTNPGAGAMNVAGIARTFIEHLIGAWIGQATEGWQQFVVHARDERGDSVTDFILEVLTKSKDGDWVAFPEMYTDVHAYGGDPSYRCFHIRLPLGLCENKVPLRIRVHASTGTELMAYQGYGEQEQQLDAKSLPVEIEVGRLGTGSDSLFHPFTTTLIEIVLNREPLPFKGESRLFVIEPPGVV